MSRAVCAAIPAWETGCRRVWPAAESGAPRGKAKVSQIPSNAFVRLLGLNTQGTPAEGVSFVNPSDAFNVDVAAISPDTAISRYIHFMAVDSRRPVFDEVILAQSVNVEMSFDHTTTIE
jgi:hypothetical protein